MKPDPEEGDAGPPAVSSTVRSHALAFRRELEGTLPELRPALDRLDEEQFVAEFDRHVRTCALWQKRTYPLVALLGLGLLAFGLALEREADWYGRAALYLCLVTLAADRYMSRFIAGRRRLFCARLAARPAQIARRRRYG